MIDKDELTLKELKSLLKLAQDEGLKRKLRILINNFCEHNWEYDCNERDADSCTKCFKRVG